MLTTLVHNEIYTKQIVYQSKLRNSRNVWSSFWIVLFFFKKLLHFGTSIYFFQILLIRKIINVLAIRIVILNDWFSTGNITKNPSNHYCPSIKVSISHRILSLMHVKVVFRSLRPIISVSVSLISLTNVNFPKKWHSVIISYCYLKSSLSTLHGKS